MHSPLIVGVITLQEMRHAFDQEAQLSDKTQRLLLTLAVPANGSDIQDSVISMMSKYVHNFRITIIDLLNNCSLLIYAFTFGRGSGTVEHSAVKVWILQHRGLILHSGCICSLGYFLFQPMIHNWSIKAVVCAVLSVGKCI